MTGMATSRASLRERQILDAAARLFAERGYSSTTIRDIGTEAGLNHATMNYYFRGKASVLFAIYQEALDGFLADLDTVEAAPADAMREVVRLAAHAALRQPQQTAVYFQELRWLEQLLEPEMVAVVRQRQNVFRGRVCGIVEAGVSEGTFRPIDPMMAVEIVVAVARWAYQSSVPPTKAAIENCADVVLSGIQKQ